MSKDSFRFYLPAELSKAKNSTTGQDEMLVKGIASTTSQDSQGEFLDPSGFNLDTFRWLNWNHLGKDDPSKIIGEPIRGNCKVTAKNEFYIEGRLYPEIDAATGAYKLMKALENSSMGNKLALSVEGKVLERDPKNPKRATKCRITSVALCPTPINGDTWVDLLKKGFSDEDLDKSEQYDEDTQKILDSLIPQEKELKKSDIFVKIVQRYPDVDQNTAQSIFNLIQKTTIMSEKKTVSEETLNKSFDLLDKASELLKAEKEKLGKGWDENGKKAGAYKDENTDESEDKDLTEKATKKAKMLKKGWDENAKKAGGYNDAGYTDSIKAKLNTELEKSGYGSKVIEKAVKDALNSKEEEDTSTDEREVKKSINALTLQVRELVDLNKAQSDIFLQSFKAIGSVLKSQDDENQELKKSLDEILTINTSLQEEIGKVVATPGQRKSIGTKSYTERFQKSEDGKKMYNISNPVDRKQLIRDINDLSGLNKGEGYDKPLVAAAQELELTKGLSVKNLQLLEKHDIKVMVNS